MNLRELVRLTGVAERQVRFLIAEGFVPPPGGGRANADYGDDHVAAIGRYTRLHDLGFPPAAIRILLQAEEGVPFPIAPGITLVVAPGMLGSGLPAPIEFTLPGVGAATRLDSLELEGIVLERVP